MFHEILKGTVSSYMLTTNMEQKLKKLKKYIDGKLSQQDRSLKEVCSALKENFTKEVKVKSELRKQLEEQNDKTTFLEADKAMLH